MLPGGQRAVILLRDMEGRDAAETCEMLEISAENQRVLLHRARCRIRREIDQLIGIRPAVHEAPARPPRARAAGIGDRIARALHVLASFARFSNAPMPAIASAR